MARFGYNQPNDIGLSGAVARAGRGLAMSQNQKLLKIMSFIALIAAFGMAAFAVMSLAFANTSPGLLLAICVIVQCFLDAALGVWGVAAANRPARSCETPFVGLSWLALVLNIAAVVVTVLIGGFPWPPIVNCVIVFVYFYYARNVRQEALD